MAAAEVLDVFNGLDTRTFLVAAAGVVFDFFGGLAPLSAWRFQEVYALRIDSLQMEFDLSSDVLLIL